MAAAITVAGAGKVAGAPAAAGDRADKAADRAGVAAVAGAVGAGKEAVEAERERVAAAEVAEALEGAAGQAAAAEGTMEVDKAWAEAAHRLGAAVAVAVGAARVPIATARGGVPPDRIETPGRRARAR
jgi:hypothetical protein